MAASVVVLIDKAGKVTVEVNGVRGAGCESMSEQMERSLGKTKEREYKADRFVQAEQFQVQT